MASGNGFAGKDLVEKSVRGELRLKLSGGAVRLLQLRTRDILEIESDGSTNKERTTCLAMARSIVDSAGVRIFDDADADKLLDLPLQDFRALDDAIGQLNPLLSGESLEQAEKNSEAAPSGGRRTSSRSRSAKKTSAVSSTG